MRRDGSHMDKMTHKEIADKAWQIALYDVGFCFYVFFFLGAFGFNCWGLTLFRECAHTGPGWSAVGIKLMYAVLVWNYFFLWYCCQSCSGRNEARKTARKEAKEAKTKATAKAPAEHVAPPHLEV